MLGVSTQTIYAYVSRGRLRSVESPDDVRRRLYLRSDVEALVQKQQLRREPKMAARTALDWGSPVLESSISQIQDGRLSYRGHAIEVLVEDATYEEVLSLLWVGSRDTAWLTVPDLQSLFVDELMQNLLGMNVPGMTRFLMGMPLLDVLDERGYDWTAESLRRCGLVTLGWMAFCLTSGRMWRDSLARTLVDGWGLGDDALSLLNKALILCAEHELNISTFTGRCAISAGTTPFGALAASAYTLGGRRHAGTTARIEAMLAEASEPQLLAQTIRARRQRGDTVPGFAHPLYTDGDIRTRLLFEAILESPFAPNGRGWIDAAKQCSARFYEQMVPTIDMALVILARTLKLPANAPLALFGLGRCAGWVAHLIEQTEDSQLIRPRAYYTGS